MSDRGNGRPAVGRTAGSGDPRRARCRGQRPAPSTVCLFLATFALLPSAGSAQEKPPSGEQATTHARPAWKAGNIWRLWLILSRPGMDQDNIEMHVGLTGGQNVDGHDCWYLHFIPVHAPADFGKGYRAALDKKNGVLRQIAPRDSLSKLLPALPPGLPFPAEPPEGIPWEVLPLVGTTPAKATGKDAQLQVTSRREKGHTWWEATITEGDDTVLVVKQKWLDGAPWWSEYERWYGGHFELSGKLIPAGQPIEAVQKQYAPKISPLEAALKFHKEADRKTEFEIRKLAVLGSPEEKAKAQAYLDAMKKRKSAATQGTPDATKPAAKEKSPAANAAEVPEGVADLAKQFPLRFDLRLRPRFTIVGNPTLGDLLRPLAETTGLTFTLADNLARHDPDLGHFDLKDTYAWAFMEILTERDIQNGRWEKTESGYRLEGTSTRMLPPAPNHLGWWLGALGLVLVVAALFLVRRRQRATTS